MSPLIIGAIVAVLLIIIIGVWYAVSTQQAQADAQRAAEQAAADAAAAKAESDRAAAQAAASQAAAIQASTAAAAVVKPTEFVPNFKVGDFVSYQIYPSNPDMLQSFCTAIAMVWVGKVTKVSADGTTNVLWNSMASTVYGGRQASGAPLQQGHCCWFRPENNHLWVDSYIGTDTVGPTYMPELKVIFSNDEAGRKLKKISYLPTDCSAPLSW
jgi:hypothetical protein